MARESTRSPPGRRDDAPSGRCSRYGSESRRSRSIGRSPSVPGRRRAGIGGRWSTPTRPEPAGAAGTRPRVDPSRVQWMFRDPAGGGPGDLRGRNDRGALAGARVALRRGRRPPGRRRPAMAPRLPDRDLAPPASNRSMRLLRACARPDVERVGAARLTGHRLVALSRVRLPMESPDEAGLLGRCAGGPRPGSRDDEVRPRSRDQARGRSSTVAGRDRRSAGRS